MYDELVKRLREDAEWAEANEWETPITLSDNLKQAADAIEELQGKAKVLEKLADKWCEAVPKWIPVTERLPEVRTWVLCYCRANSFDVFRMTDEGNWQYGNRSIYMKGYVTHWMPLPPAPKEE